MDEACNRQTALEPLAKGALGNISCGMLAHGYRLIVAGLRRGFLADDDLRVGREGIGRDRQIDRRRTAADAAGGVEDRAMAGAEPAMILTLLAERHAAQMGAVSENDQPLGMAFLHAG